MVDVSVRGLASPLVDRLRRFALPARFLRGSHARVALAGACLAVFLVATSWLVTPSPAGIPGFAAFTALSTACELLLWIALVLLTGRPWGSAALFALLAVAVIITNNIKYQYTGVAALPVDVYAAAGVLSNLDTFLGYVGFHTLEAVGLVIFVVLTVAGFVKERPVFSLTPGSFAARAVALVAIGWLFWPITSREAPVQRLFASVGASFDGSDPNRSVLAMGLFAHLVSAAPEFFPSLPTSYGDADLFDRYYRSLDRPAAPVADRPDVVIVLSESLFDPRSLRVAIEPDPLAVLDALARQSAYHGRLRVATIGGGTVRAEYSVLTGIPTSVLGQGGQWPFYSLVTGSTWSLAKYFAALDYQTTVVYPVPGSLFNARQAYRDLGFSKMLDLTDFDAARDLGVRYVKDEAVARKVVEVLDAADRPAFVFALTMETHGPWSFREYTGSRRYRVEADLGRDDLDVLDGYVHRLPNVESLATTIRDHLEARGRPYVFALFGDHLPAMFDVFDRVGFRDDLPWGRPRFLTPYVVLTNTGAVAGPVERNVEVSFLGSLVVDAAGLEPDEFFGMSSAYREFCGGSFESCGAGDEYRAGYIQIIYDNLREHLSGGSAAGGVADRSLAAGYRLGDVIRPGSQYFGAGWSVESTRMWSVEPSAYLTVRLTEDPPPTLTLAARMQIAESVTGAEMLVNGRVLGTWTATSARRLQERRVEIPGDLVPEDSTLRVEFRVSDAISQSEAGTGWDTRPLGVALYGLRFCSAAESCVVPE